MTATLFFLFPFSFDARDLAFLANRTNSAGHDHMPNIARAASATFAASAASMSPRHWLQQRCARLM
ncbi:MAG: hypothetical protein ACLUCU_07585, partial [Slackia sp.]